MLRTPFPRLIALGIALLTLAGSRAFAQSTIPQTNWTLRYVDSQETVYSDSAAIHAFDGNPNSAWTTQWGAAQPPPPHEIQINLGASYSVSGFRYLPRQDGAPYGRIAQYEFYVSADGTSWGSAVAAGTFPDTMAEQQVLFSAKTGQYVRLRALTEVAGRPYSVVAELNVVGVASGNQPPNSTITAPTGNVTIAPGGSVTFAGTGSDPNNNTPFTYAWNFGAGGPAASTNQNPGAVVFPTAGVYAVTFTVTDALGLADPTPATRTITVNAAPNSTITAPAGNVTIAPGGSVTFTGTGSDPNNNTPFTYAWNFGAGGPAASTSQNPGAVVFPTAGVYAVTFTVTDALGLADPTPATRTITVNAAPNSTITAPAGNVTIAPGGSVTFTGTGSDPNNNTPFTYAWNFGAGGPAASTNQNPGAVVFPTAGVYAVTFTVTDALGLADPTPATRTITVQSSAVIPQTNWTLRFVDSQETDAGNYAATNAFDGNPNTMWNSHWSNGGPLPPHELQIDLGATFDVDGFRYLPGQPWQAGRVGEYEFYVSTNGTDWGTPTAVGAFADTNSGAAIDVPFVQKTGRYVRFRALTEVNNNSYNFNSLAELNVLRAAPGVNPSPVPTMTSPSHDLTILPGSAISLSGSATDPNGNLPLTYRWSVSAGSGITDLSGAQPGFVQFERPGTYVVTLTVADALGAAAVATHTVTVPADLPIAKTGWTLHYVDSQETTASDSAATHAFDGNPNSAWTTQWGAAQPPPPHEIQIDLGATHSVSGFKYLPRQDGASYGNIGQYEFYVSDDFQNWGSAVATGTFANSGTEKTVTTSLKTGRYVRLRALTEVNSLPYTVVAELNVLERQCIAPSVRLIQPTSRYLQPSSVLPVSADACLNLGQGVRLKVDGIAAPDRYAAPYAVTVSNLTQAEHTIEALVISAAGLPVSGDATYDVATPVGIGDFYVAIGDGMTVGFGDDKPDDDNSQDGRNMMGGYTSILADLLTSAKGYPVTVVNEGASGTASIHGLAALPTLIAKYPNAQRFLIIYGHNDYLISNAPSGLGLHPGQSGYAGSFKDNIQRMIDLLKAAGKTAVLSKAPGVLPFGGATDMHVQEFNQVIDELYNNPVNAIPVPPPDFRAYFLNHPEEYSSDNIVLSGLGYLHMAQLWRNALVP